MAQTSSSGKRDRMCTESVTQPASQPVNVNVQLLFLLLLLLLLPSPPGNGNRRKIEVAVVEIEAGSQPRSSFTLLFISVSVVASLHFFFLLVSTSALLLNSARRRCVRNSLLTSLPSSLFSIGLDSGGGGGGYHHQTLPSLGTPSE